MLLLPLSSIDDSNRQREDYGDVAGLAKSIAEHGLLQPIVVTEHETDYGRFRLIAGGRRFRAHQSLQKPSVPAILLSSLPASTRELLELEENIRRKDLEWPELVRGVARFAALDGRTPAEIAAVIQYSVTSVNIMISLAPELARRPQLLTASSFSSAWSLFQAESAKAADAAIEDVLSGVFDIAADGSVTIAAPPPPLPGTPLNLTGPTLPAAPPPAPKPIFTQQESFLTWAPNYSGRRFNLIHCDFPYGLNMDTANLQGSSDRWTSEFAGRYDDSPELFDQLTATFFEHQDRFITGAAHCIFWLAHKNFGRIWSRFRHFGWTPCEVPLIWHKSDGAGIAPDVRRQPRRTYEIAVFATRGDRKITGVKAASFAAPTTKEHHLSEKPLAVVNHFLEMLVDEHTEILDPTCGSGTALEAAIKLGAVRALGLDVLSEHTAHTERRCHAAERARGVAADSSVADLI